MYDELKFENCDYTRDPVVGCALEGVANIIAGISDACLVIHSPQGCSSTVASAYDHHETDFTRRKVACSRLFETDIIMGATDKLKDLIRQADTTFKSSVMFVVGTCAADIIGENIEGICSEIQEEIGAKLIPVIAGGFRGTGYDGMNLGLDALFAFIKPHEGTKPEKSVNIIAPQASLNPTWWADTGWVVEVLQTMGVGVNTVFSHDTALENISAASLASANILLSHDAGYSFAKKMEAEFGVPLILSGMPLPVGCSNTREWLRALGTHFGTASIAEEIIAKGEEKVIDILRRRGLMIIPRYRNCRIAVSADSTFGIGLMRMLFEELEMIPELVMLRSDNAHSREVLKDELDRLGISPKVVFGADGYAIKKALSESDVDAVLGSSWERYIAEELGIKLSFDILTPTNRDIYIDRPYFGYDGMLNMLEIIGNDWEGELRSKEIRWEQFMEKA
jgi:light-independent protochlorophyllide reductase B subunit